MEELPVYIPRPKICRMTQYQCCKHHRDCPLYPRCSQIQFHNTVCCQDCPSCTYKGCSLTPQQRQEQPVYIDHVIQQERLDLNLEARRWQEQQAHKMRHQKLYEYYNNLFGDRLERIRKTRHDRYWADPYRFRAEQREAYEKRRSKERDGHLNVDGELIPLDLFPDCGLDCFNCPFEDCTLPEDWLSQKRKEKTIKRIRFGSKTTQELLGWRSFTPYGLATDKGELLFFEIAPVNISVLSPDTVEQKILDLTKLLAAIPNLEVVCLDSAESFDKNKIYLHKRIEAEQNPILRELLQKDLDFLDNIQIEMSTARQFLFMVRCFDLKPEQVFHTVNEAEKKIAGNHFTARRLGKADIKRFLALYFDAGDYGDRLPDMDDGKYM